ncbi:hypothetical protein RHS01_04952 [Rhizoctonia solani]|uniref:F-box/LRR-repeat protein 15/At3g58940/PEG3-like LRR domain-containing protein n=1 Tax=Rhizoctonia solani TaxID=456999 RepID=A0A8H7IG26_9AGAM|nr:hypothetical protein RHS01_04952 [Rhizoctonia solani]
MPKRREAPTRKTASSAKRIKFSSFGAPNETDDLPQAHVAAQQQSASYATRVLAMHFKTLCLSASENLRIGGPPMLRRLSDLPDTLIPNLLLLLREYCPTYLRSDIITTYLLRGREIRLSGDFPGVITSVLAAIGVRHNAGIITTLELTELPAIADQTFATVVARLPELDILNLRKCSKAGPLVLDAAASKCPRLKVLNMNYTVATPRSILSVLLACRELEVLKIAGSPKLISGSIGSSKSHTEANPDDEIPTFNSLKSLKLRLTKLGDSDLAAFFFHCPNLTTLDISFTQVKNIPIISPFPPLKKLCLTSTRVSGTNLVNVLDNCSELEVLYLGAFGKTLGAASGSGNILTDSLLRDITDVLERCPNLRSISLVSNTRLGAGGSVGRALQDFVKRVGRRCEILDFENIPQLRSGDLEGLLSTSEYDQPSPLRALNVARTGVNGDAAMFIAACPKLAELDIASTRFGKEELFTILDCCPDLIRLDLTGCRSVPLQDRRRFFEVWESAREDGSSLPSFIIMAMRVNWSPFTGGLGAKSRPPTTQFLRHSQTRLASSGLVYSSSRPSGSEKSKFNWTSPTTLRLKWKVALIEELEEKSRREPLVLPKRINLSVLPEFAYRRVLLTGTWDPDPSHTILLGPRTRDNVLGYHIISPLIRGDGASSILVNRGFVSRDTLEQGKQIMQGVRSDIPKTAALVADAAKQGKVQVVGMLTSAAKRNSFTPDNKPETGEWYWADADAMAKVASGQNGDVQPVLVDELFAGDGAEASRRSTHGFQLGVLLRLSSGTCMQPMLPPGTRYRPLPPSCSSHLCVEAEVEETRNSRVG